MDLSEAPTEDKCQPVETLHTIARSAPDGPFDYIHDVPLVWKDLGSKGIAVACEYSSNWAEHRRLFFVFNQNAPQVEVQLVLDTDYGCFLGQIMQHGPSGSTSTAHKHGDRLCFDLNVEWLTGHKTEERMIGSLSLK